MSKQRTESFWEAMQKSAEPARSSPSWMKAGINLSEANFITHHSMSRAHPRVGDFTSLAATASQFWPLDPRPEEVHLEDIARALSMQCRWGGHVNQFYSVAQHCVLVSRHCLNHPIEGLLHDAAEAYLVDVPTPIKKHLHGYDEIERNLLSVIGQRFDVWLKDLPEEVHIADARTLATEQRDLRPRLNFWTPPAEPWRDPILVAWEPRRAEREFLKRAVRLGLR